MIFSGGVDSTILAVLLKKIAEERENKLINHENITSYAKPLNIILYSVGVGNSQDINFSEEIAKDLNLPLKTIIIDENTVKESIKPVLTAIEDDNVMKLGVGMTIYLAAKAMKEDGIKVALSGQGADETADVFRSVSGIEQYGPFLPFDQGKSYAHGIRNMRNPRKSPD